MSSAGSTCACTPRPSSSTSTAPLSGTARPGAPTGSGSPRWWSTTGGTPGRRGPARLPQRPDVHHPHAGGRDRPADPARRRAGRPRADRGRGLHRAGDGRGVRRPRLRGDGGRAAGPRAAERWTTEVAAIVEAHVREHVDLRARRGRHRGLAHDPDVVVLSTGVRPASTVAAAAGARTGPGGALITDERMRTSLPGVWAAGDCIAPHHRVLGAPAFVPLGPGGEQDRPGGRHGRRGRRGGVRRDRRAPPS